MAAHHRVKRVCYVLPSLDVGETERQVVYLARGLAADHEVTVICTRREGPFASDLRAAGVHVQVLRSPRLGSLSCSILTVRLRGMFRRHRPDILHTFLSGVDLPANRAARRTGVPVVISTRQEWSDRQRPRCLRLQLKANELTDCIVASCRAEAESLMRREGVPPGRVRVIPKAVDVDAAVTKTDPVAVRAQLGVPKGARVVGIVAGFTPAKDHLLFLASAQTLLQRRSDVHFLMVGTGPLRRAIERQVRRMGLRKQFACTSAVGALAHLYHVMDVSVLCSKAEGMPTAVLEAMAAGTPVVAAAVGGVPEIIEDGVTGRLVHSRSPEAFAEAIAWVLDHPESAQEMKEKAARRAREEFSVDKMVAAYCTLYNELLAHSVGLQV